MKFARRLFLLAAIGILLVSAVTSVRAVDRRNEVNWLSHYATARRTSAKAQRPVFLVMTLDNCPHCVRMKNEMRQSPSVVKSLKKDFVPLVVNGAIDPVLARQLRVDIYPTTVIIAPNGKVLDYMRGYVSPTMLTTRMASAIAAESRIARRTDK